MAANVVITRPDVFPATTKVKVFAFPTTVPGNMIEANRAVKPNPENWKAALSKQGEYEVASAGTLEITGAKPVQYLLYASVAANGENRYTNVTLEEGKATVVSSSATFTEAMVGKPITGLGVPPGTFVKTFTDTEHLVMNKNAEISLTTSATVVIGSPDKYMLVKAPLGIKDQSVVAGSVKTVKVETTTTSVVAANTEREGLQISNTGATACSLQLGSGAAVLKEGIFLAANGGSWDGMIGPVVWTGAVQGIAETGAVNVAVAEV